MQLIWSWVHLLFCLLYLIADEEYKAMLTFRQCLCGLCCFSPCHSQKQLLSFNPLKPLVSHQNMALLECNPLTSVPQSHWLCMCAWERGQQGF